MITKTLTANILAEEVVLIEWGVQLTLKHVKIWNQIGCLYNLNVLGCNSSNWNNSFSSAVDDSVTLYLLQTFPSVEWGLGIVLGVI